MKSKFKDYLLYTLSTIGVVALFISATALPTQTSTVPESHVYQGFVDDSSPSLVFYSLNKQTGDVKAYLHTEAYKGTKYIGLKQWSEIVLNFGQQQ